MGEARLRWGASQACLVGLMVAASAGHARAAAKSLPIADIERLTATLGGDDEARAVLAAKQLGESGAANAVAPLVDALSVGTTPVTAAEVIGALQKLHDVQSLQILTLYAGNRNVPVRRAAVAALGAINDPRVTGTLLERLGDVAIEVRAAAADALAARQEKLAMPRLLKLVGKSDSGVAVPLGKLLPMDDLPQLIEISGRVEGRVMATVFTELLRRSDATDSARLDVVRAMARDPGAAATAALRDYVRSVPQTEKRASRDEAQKLVGGRK